MIEQKPTIKISITGNRRSNTIDFFGYVLVSIEYDKKIYKKDTTLSRILFH